MKSGIAKALRDLVCHHRLALAAIVVMQVMPHLPGRYSVAAATLSVLLKGLLPRVTDADDEVKRMLYADLHSPPADVPPPPPAATHEHEFRTPPCCGYFVVAERAVHCPRKT